MLAWRTPIVHVDATGGWLSAYWNAIHYMYMLRLETQCNMPQRRVRASQALCDGGRKAVGACVSSDVCVLEAVRSS